MADIVSTQVISDTSGVKYVVKMTNISDGSGESLVKKIDASSATFMTEDGSRKIAKIWWSVNTTKSNASVELVWGGETTVKIKGSGLGGRNQELALIVAELAHQDPIRKSWTFLSGGTDGRDGPTEAAGAIVDQETCKRILNEGYQVYDFLAENNSNKALKISNDLLHTGATGTNVADVQILIVSQ